MILPIYQRKELSSDEYENLLIRKNQSEARDVYQTAEKIIQEIESRGIEAVRQYSLAFDGVIPDPLILSVEDEVCKRAENSLSKDLKAAFAKAAENIHRFHLLQKESFQPKETKTAESLLVGFYYVPVESVAIYVPGGLASYPSSVLMGVIPAKIAGVSQCTVISPPSNKNVSTSQATRPHSFVDPAVVYCARLTGADFILQVGGIQGIATAALGLVGSPCSLIVGPGNRYVTAAKSLLASQGKIRMDLPAGPSEVAIIADQSAKPEFIAADLLSQAEHGRDSSCVLLTDSLDLAQKTTAEIEKGIQNRPSRRAIKTESMQNHSFILVFEDIEEAFSFTNSYAPEHLELCVSEPQKALAKIRNAGSIFLGHYAPVALGDYYSGTNHILPTGGSARFYSGLGVDSFLKRVTYQYPSQQSLKEALPSILLMSEHEGFDQEHGHSVSVRFGNEHLEEVHEGSNE